MAKLNLKEQLMKENNIKDSNSFKKQKETTISYIRRMMKHGMSHATFQKGEFYRLTHEDDSPSENVRITEIERLKGFFEKEGFDVEHNKYESCVDEYLTVKW